MDRKHENYTRICSPPARCARIADRNDREQVASGAEVTFPISRSDLIIATMEFWIPQSFSPQRGIMIHTIWDYNYDPFMGGYNDYSHLSNKQKKH